jgi:hypothetical protein
MSLSDPTPAFAIACFAAAARADPLVPPPQPLFGQVDPCEWVYGANATPNMELSSVVCARGNGAVAFTPAWPKSDVCLAQKASGGFMCKHVGLRTSNKMPAFRRAPKAAT